MYFHTITYQDIKVRKPSQISLIPSQNYRVAWFLTHNLGTHAILKKHGAWDIFSWGWGGEGVVATVGAIFCVLKIIRLRWYQANTDSYIPRHPKQERVYQGPHSLNSYIPSHPQQERVYQGPHLSTAVYPVILNRR